jgi:hypothetical protein
LELSCGETYVKGAFVSRAAVLLLPGEVHTDLYDKTDVIVFEK